MKMMRNTLLLTAFSLSTLLAFSQPENSLLWKITPKKGKQVSYLFGSMHTNDSLCNTWSDAWWQAFHSCNMVLGETNFVSPDMKDAMGALMLSMMKDTSLKDLFPPTDFAFVDSILTIPPA